MGYPDWQYPIVFVLQEGELWPILEWVSRQGQFKSWRIQGSITASGTVEDMIYTVPANKVLYVVSHIPTANGDMRSDLHYYAPKVNMGLSHTLAYTSFLERFNPPIKLIATKDFRVITRNLEASSQYYYHTILAYELPV